MLDGRLSQTLVFLNTFYDGDMMIFFQDLLKFLIQDSVLGFEYSEKF
jgi:hypothetical protein